MADQRQLCVEPGGVLIKQVLSPLIVRTAHQPHDVSAGMKIEGVGLTHELHAGFKRHLIALAPIARMAASHEVLPGRGSSSGTWHDVVQCQFTRRQQLPAVLASVAIAQENVLARQGTRLVRDSTIFQ